MVTIEDAKKKLPDGWHSLIDKVYTLAEENNEPVKFICDKMSWLRVNIHLIGKAYYELMKIEDESHVTCMHCGAYGKLRDHYTVLCEECHDRGVKKSHGKTFIAFE